MLVSKNSCVLVGIISGVEVVIGSIISGVLVGVISGVVVDMISGVVVGVVVAVEVGSVSLRKSLSKSGSSGSELVGIRIGLFFCLGVPKISWPLAS